MPSPSIVAASLLVYRENSRGKRELLVRFVPSDRRTRYSIPSQAILPGEKAIDCARRVGPTSLELSIPDKDINREASAILNNTGDSKKVHVFMIRSFKGSSFEAIAERDIFRGWKYTFLPFSALGDVWLHEGIDVPQEALQIALSGC